MSAEEVLTNLGKLRTADHARLMADNQRTLDATAKQDAWQRDLTRRVTEAQAAQAGVGNLSPAAAAAEEPVNIYVDSPITIHPAATPAVAPAVSASPTIVPPAAAAKSTAAKLAPYFLVAAGLASGGGIGAAIVHALTPAANPAATGTPNDFPVYDVQAWKPAP